jgi:septum formation protein
MGLAFTVEVSDADERLLPGETPQSHTRRLAESKARTVAARRPGAWVLGADTTVVIDRLILGKPKDERDAARMLGLLAGRTHVVVSSFCLVPPDGGDAIVETSESRVAIRSLTAPEIRWYIATGEPLDKAGAYAVQGIGAALVTRIEGSYTNVVGLPLAETVQALERAGLLRLAEEA